MENLTVQTTFGKDTYSNLRLLSIATKCSEAKIIEEAVRVYIEDQTWQIEAIKEGVRQAEAENFASEDDIKKTFSKWGVDV